MAENEAPAARYQITALNDQQIYAITDTETDTVVSRPMRESFAKRYAAKLNAMTDPQELAELLASVGNPNPLA